MANKIPATSVKKKHKDVINERNMLSTTAFAISRKLDDVVKRSRSTRQCILILLKSIMNTQSKHRPTDNLCNITSSNSRRIAHNQKKPFNLQDLFWQSVRQAIDICIQVREERDTGWIGSHENGVTIWISGWKCCDMYTFRYDCVAIMGKSSRHLISMDGLLARSRRGYTSTKSKCI